MVVAPCFANTDAVWWQIQLGLSKRASLLVFYPASSSLTTLTEGTTLAAILGRSNFAASLTPVRGASLRDAPYKIGMTQGR